MNFQKEMVKVCLNLIFKNDSSMLSECLKSVAPFIDYFMLCDTGSVDNSREVIQEWKTKHEKVGTIIKEEFKNYSYNKNFLLAATIKTLNALDGLVSLEEHKENEWFILFMNPSDVITKTPDELLSIIATSRCPFYRGTIEGSGTTRAVLVKASIDIRWIGSACEVLIPRGRRIQMKTLDDFVIEDRTKFKTTRHICNIRLLEQELKVNGPNHRTVFNLAESYRKCGLRRLLPIAEQLFVRRSKMKHRPAEIYVSLFRAAECRMLMGINDNVTLEYALEALKYDETRLEAPYMAMVALLKKDNVIAAKALGRSFIKFTKGPVFKKNLKSYHCRKEIHTWGFSHTLALIFRNTGEKLQCKKLIGRIDTDLLSEHAKALLRDTIEG